MWKRRIQQTLKNLDTNRSTQSIYLASVVGKLEQSLQPQLLAVTALPWIRKPQRNVCSLVLTTNSDSCPFEEQQVKPGNAHEFLSGSVSLFDIQKDYMVFSRRSVCLLQKTKSTCHQASWSFNALGDLKKKVQ